MVHVCMKLIVDTQVPGALQEPVAQSNDNQKLFVLAAACASTAMSLARQIDMMAHGDIA